MVESVSYTHLGADASGQNADEGVAGDLAESNVINGALFQGGTLSVSYTHLFWAMALWQV